MEAWKDIPGTYYSVSNEGRVVSRRHGKRRVLKVFPNGGGYPVVAFWAGGVGRKYVVHRLVAKMFLEPQPSPLHEINHKNGMKADPRAANLEWVTRSENCRHALDILGHKPARGERVKGAILTKELVGEIRVRLAAGEIQKDIAARYGIARSTVGSLAQGVSWAWVDAEA